LDKNATAEIKVIIRIHYITNNIKGGNCIG